MKVLSQISLFRYIYCLFICNRLNLQIPEGALSSLWEINRYRVFPGWLYLAFTASVRQG